MCLLRLSVFSLLAGLALAQNPSDVFEKAPPAIDDALRARVTAFYQAHVDGKFRKADDYVAEEAKDAFFVAEKPHFRGFDISKITYSDNFTKATVVTAAKTEMVFHGERLPVTMPAVTHWKIDNGEWFWYYVQPSEMETPFGTMKGGPQSDREKVIAQIPRDPKLAAAQILSQIKLDRNEVVINQTRSSSDVVHLKNGLMGPINISADPTGMPGLTVRPEKPQVQSGEEVAIIVNFNFDDPDNLCKQCLINPGVRPPMTVNVTVQPTQQQFPIKISFTQDK